MASTIDGIAPCSRRSDLLFYAPIARHTHITKAAKMRLLSALKRRRQTRIAVKWPVEATVPKTGRAVRFQTRDISLQGIRLEGDTSEAFQQVLFGDGQAHLQLCLPDREAPLPVRGELKWGMDEAGAFTTGWRFSRLPRRSKKTLKTCIRDHSDDRIQD